MVELSQNGVKSHMLINSYRFSCFLITSQTNRLKMKNNFVFFLNRSSKEEKAIKISGKKIQPCVQTVSFLLNNMKPMNFHRNSILVTSVLPSGSKVHRLCLCTKGEFLASSSVRPRENLVIMVPVIAKPTRNGQFLFHSLLKNTGHGSNFLIFLSLSLSL